MIRLIPINEDLFEGVLNLELDKHDQRKVASVEYSLAQAWLYRDKKELEALAIVTSNHLVGFLLLVVDKERHSRYLWRLLIDKHHQNKGYGTEALRQVIAQAKADDRCTCIEVAYVIGNHKMRSILEKLGFQPSGMVGNELKMTLHIHKEL